MSSAANAFSTADSWIVIAIPGTAGKVIAFRQESVNTFSQESRSPSPRKSDFFQPGIVITFARIPQRQGPSAH
jgi:hypothetical protein